jgi:integrase/recombinase XerC
MVQLARQLGRCAWSIDIGGLRFTYVKQPPPAVRNLALVRLLHDLGLRRGEVCSLDLDHYDQSRGQIAVKGKGKLERIRLSVPGPVRTALDAWIRIRGLDPGPLFHGLRRGSEGGRLSANGLYAIVTELGRQAGLVRRLRPHGLRHAAITAVLDRSGGNVRAAQRFSRHANLQTLVRYDDNRTDLGGEMARLISEE